MPARSIAASLLARRSVAQSILMTSPVVSGRAPSAQGKGSRFGRRTRQHRGLSDLFDSKATQSAWRNPLDFVSFAIAQERRADRGKHRNASGRHIGLPGKYQHEVV